MRPKTPYWYLKVIIGLIFISLLASYAYIQSDDFARGPEITILSPSSGTMIEDSLISIEGIAQRVAKLELNGDSIFIDEKGNFREQLLLVEGQNIITLSAEDKFGREVKEIVELIHKP